MDIKLRLCKMIMFQSLCLQHYVCTQELYITCTFNVKFLVQSYFLSLPSFLLYSFLSSFFSFYVYVCICIVYLRECVGYGPTYLQAEFRARQPLGVFLFCSFSHALRCGLSLNQKLTVLASQDDCPASSQHVFILLCWCTAGHGRFLGFQVGDEDLNSCPWSSYLLNKYFCSLSHLTRCYCSFHQNTKE